MWALAIKKALGDTYHFVVEKELYEDGMMHLRHLARCNSRIKLTMKHASKTMPTEGHVCEICKNIHARLVARAAA